MNNFSVDRRKDIVTIRAPLVKNSNWERYVLIQADQHFDSVHCDRSLLRRDLELARKRNAIILSAGDQLDLMQGRRDPRGSKSELRPEYNKSNYFKAVIDDAAEFFGRYADLYAIMCHGNHETACIKNSERDPTEDLVELINRNKGTNIVKGEYEEFIRLTFVSPSAERRGREAGYSKLFYIYHGFGGASPVTGGVIHNHRVAEFVKADFVVMGHLHTVNIDQRVWWEVTNQDTVLEKTATFLRTGSYKKSRTPGETTWETVKGIKPKPRGAIWLRFSWDYSTRDLRADVIRSC